MVRGYVIFVFNQATWANSAWPSLRWQAKLVLAVVMATVEEEMVSFAKQLAVNRAGRLVKLLCKGSELPCNHSWSIQTLRSSLFVLC